MAKELLMATHSESLEHLQSLEEVSEQWVDYQHEVDQLTQWMSQTKQAMSNPTQSVTSLQDRLDLQQVRTHTYQHTHTHTHLAIIYSHPTQSVTSLQDRLDLQQVRTHTTQQTHI